MKTRLWWITRFVCFFLTANDLASAAGNFSPATIPGLTVWLRADSLTNAPGSIITNWPDSSGNHFDATNANPAQAPTLNSNRINHLPALTGDGVVTFLATKPLSLSNSFTLFFVANKRSSNVAIPLAIGPVNDNPGYYLFRDTNYNAAWFAAFWHGDFANAIDMTQPVLESFLCSASNQTQFINGVATQSGSPASFNVAGSVVLFAHSLLTAFYDGDISEFLLYTNALSLSDHAKVTQYLLQKYLPGQHLSFFGDSLTYGENADFQETYPDQVVKLLGGDNNFFQAENVGIGGASVASSTAELPIATPSLNRTGHDIAVIWFGDNDSVGTSVNIFYQGLVAECQSLRQAGVKVVVVDVLPRIGNENFRLAANSLIRSNWQQFADALADIGADPTIGVTNALTNSLYYGADMEHPTTLGYAYVATNVYNAILTLPPLLVQSPAAANVLTWSPPFSLQSATSPSGPYTNVPAAASPYTNSALPHPALFFRLRSPTNH